MASDGRFFHASGHSWDSELESGQRGGNEYSTWQPFLWWKPTTSRCNTGEIVLTWLDVGELDSFWWFSWSVWPSMTESSCGGDDVSGSILWFDDSHSHWNVKSLLALINFWQFHYLLFVFFPMTVANVNRFWWRCGRCATLPTLFFSSFTLYEAFQVHSHNQSTINHCGEEMIMDDYWIPSTASICISF